MRILLAGLLVMVAISLAFADEPEKKELAEPPTQSPERLAVDKLRRSLDGDAAEVQRLFDKIVREYPGTEEADAAVVYYSEFLEHQGQLDKAEKMLLALRRADRQNIWVSMALYRLVEVARKRGDERAMIAYLEGGLKPRMTASGRELDEDQSTRQNVLNTLAHYYRRKGEWMKALAYFTRWDPQSFCGNCQMSLLAERNRGLALCLLGVGDHPTVLRSRLQSLSNEDSLGGFSSWVVWRLYADANQLADLRRMIDKYETDNEERLAKRKGLFLPTKYLRDLLRVQTLIDNKDIAALADLCQEADPRGNLAEINLFDGGEYDVARSTAAEALAACDGKEIEVIKAALAKDPKVKGWLVYALGRSKAPSALKILEDAVGRIGDRDQDFYITDNLAFALALKGEAGNRVLKRIASQKTRMGKSAYRALSTDIEPVWPTTYWPPPRAGSLPKVLEDVR